MNTRIATTALLLGATIFVAAPVLGQESQQPPAIFMTSWKCDRSAVQDLVEMMKTQDMVVAQELVDEGRIWSYHVMVHDWGDEWNLVNLLVADDIAAGVAASDTLDDRFEARFGEDNTFLEHCQTHRDNIYVGAFITQAPEGQHAVTPYNVSMSYFACPINKLDGIIDAAREIFLPAAQASVNAGMGYLTGAMRHAWADEWNFIIFRGAADLPSLFTFTQDTAERITAEGPVPTMSCDHKDNIYQMVLETTAATQ